MDSLSTVAVQPLWGKNCTTLVLTDTKSHRSWSTCESDKCTPASKLLKAENTAFMKNISEGLWKEMRDNLGVNSSCSAGLDDETVKVREMLMNFNLPRSAFNNIKAKNTIRRFIRQKFEEYGAEVSTQNFWDTHGVNIIATFKGCERDKSKKVLILGAHYDAVSSSHGLDDNGSGVTLLLKVAEAIGKYVKTAGMIIYAFEILYVLRQ